MNVKTDEGICFDFTSHFKIRNHRISQQSCSVLQQRDGLKSSANRFFESGWWQHAPLQPSKWVSP
jgi:hypothetical protein